MPKRSQINLFIFAPYGSGKTTLLDYIQSKGLGYKIRTWTEPALLGSIDRAGKIVPPVTIIAAGKTMLVDEFQAVPSNLRQILLSLLEEQQAYRVLSFRVPTPVKLEREFWSVYAEEGYIWFRIQCSWIICSAFLLDSEEDRMLRSRCINLHLYVTEDDIAHGGLLRGLKLDDIAQLREELRGKSNQYTMQQYSELLKYIVEVLKEEELPLNLAYRIADDVLRLDNIEKLLGHSDGLKYLSTIILGIKNVSLSPIEWAILQYVVTHHPENVQDIAKALNLPEDIVSTYVDELIKRGILVWRK